MRWSGLVDDDFGMELLVDGRIISLSLPVRQVYECVWRPARGERAAVRHGMGGPEQTPLQPTASRGEVEVIGPPMAITYRLQVTDLSGNCAPWPEHILSRRCAFQGAIAHILLDNLCMDV